MLLNENNMNQRKLMLKVKDVQEILDLSKSKTYEFMKEPPFTVLRIGSSIRIPADGFYAWLNGTMNSGVNA